MKAYYCVGTHWDREWYESFQEFRMWLVELIDELMALMAEDPEYRSFHLDGQTVVLEDYLAIRPERREQLVALIKEGRLFVGPWYVLPDEWLISGESYVRNLLTGARICEALGVEPLDFAYTPDQFGHIAALPMIMAGFGLDAGICWRGTQDEDYPAQFVWVGPDGSRMVTHKLMDKGSYGPFDMLARRPMKEAGFSNESFAQYFEPLLKDETERARIPLVLLLDAIDHQRPDPEMPRLFAELQRRYPDVEFTWGSLAEYGAAMRAQAGELPERRGELRQPARDADRVGQYLIVHTLSSRYPIKQRNDQCQALLEKWAEPMALCQRLAGGAPILSYLDRAWEHLLKNHPHDSICGCSIDQVHRDMRFRFDQCALIADGLVRRATAAIGRAETNDKALRNVVIHNPLPFARSGVFELALPFPEDWPERYIDGLATAEAVNKFALVDHTGGRVPFQLSAIERGCANKQLGPDGRLRSCRNDVYRVAVETPLPSCGYTGLRIEPVKDAVRTFGTLRTGPLAAHNGVYDFVLHTDGTADLRLRDAEHGFDGLFLYEDCGDTGDGWTRGKLISDVVLRTPGARVTTAVEEDGPLRVVFRVDRVFDVPAQADGRTGRRSETRTELRVTDRIYVEKDAPVVRVRTHVDNTCMDHRLRVLFPTQLVARHAFAETPFAVVERPIAIPPETAAWHECVNPEAAFTSFFGVKDKEHGLAVLAPFGLHEYEVTETPEAALALTLFRSTWQTVGTGGEPDGELLGPLDFEYMLYPFQGGFDPVSALRLVAGAQAGIRTHAAAESPAPHAFVELRQNNVVVTALKPSADGQGGIIRLWNPQPIDEEDLIRVDCPVEKAQRCNLKEEPLEDIALNPDGSIRVHVPALGLLTVKFTW